MAADETTAPIDVDNIPTNTQPDDDVTTAAIYARTSETKPEFHYSIPEQVERCWQRCQQHGWDVMFVFTDEAETGRNTDRSGFQDMLSRAEQGLFDVVVFWALDRFCRSVVDLVNIERQLSEWNVALTSVTEYIDTASPVGRFNFRNLASAAELESDLTSQRVQLGMNGMAKANRWPNSNPPLGYDLNDDGTLAVNDEEAELVRKIFRSYIDCKSMPTVAKKLNEEGHTPKNGDEWNRWSVRKVLTNEIYIGEYSLADYEEYVEEYRLMDDDLFDAVTETRYRFQHEKGKMGEERKEAKAKRILSQFLEVNGGRDA